MAEGGELPGNSAPEPEMEVALGRWRVAWEVGGWRRDTWRVGIGLRDLGSFGGREGSWGRERVVIFFVFPARFWRERWGCKWTSVGDVFFREVDSGDVIFIHTCTFGPFTRWMIHSKNLKTTHLWAKLDKATVI